MTEINDINFLETMEEYITSLQTALADLKQLIVTRKKNIVKQMDEMAEEFTSQKENA